MSEHREAIEFMKRSHTIYCGLKQKDIALVAADPPGRTDCESFIALPIEDPDVGLIHKHEWEHIFFRTNLRARELFARAYVNRLVREYGEVDEVEMTNFVFVISNALDDLRVNGLWARVYPGSSTLIADRWRRMLVDNKLVDRNLVLYTMAVGLGFDVGGQLNRYRPLIQEACQNVEGGGYSSVLLATRRLLDGIQDQLLRRGSGSARGRRSASEAPPAPEDPPTANDRQGAIVALSMMAGRAQPGGFRDTPEAPPGPDPDAFETHRAVQIAMGSTDREVDGAFRDSRQEMDVVLGELRSLVRPPAPDTGLLTWSDSGVALYPIRKEETLEFTLWPEDARLVLELKSRFSKLAERRRLRRTDAGNDLDVQAYVDTFFGDDFDIFLEETKTKGFEALLLIDGSASMYPRWVTVTRAAKVLALSMKFPFSKLSGWSFSGSNEGMVGIVQYQDPTFGLLPKAPLPEMWGLTPMHVAVDMGVRFLRRSSLGARHLFLVTDGQPTHFGLTHNPSDEELKNETARHVSEARAKGVAVSTLIIGNEISSSDADHMFMRGHWRRIQMQQDELFHELVAFVEQTFTHYLRR